MNILTFDVEEWFHLLDFDATRGEEQWGQYEVRIYENVERETMLKSPSAEEVFEQLAEQEQLYDAMMALTHKQRSRLYAHFFLNMGYTKIAKQEGVDVTSVKESVQRAIKQLQKKIHLF